MQNYQTKFKTLTLLFESLSFFSLIISIGLAIIAYNYQPSWWLYAGLSAFSFIVFRLITRQLLYASIEPRYTPTLSLPNRKKEDSVMRINPAHDELNYDFDLSLQPKKEKKRTTVAKKIETNKLIPSKPIIDKPKPIKKIDDNEEEIPILTEIVQENQYKHEAQPTPAKIKPKNSQANNANHLNKLKASVATKKPKPAHQNKSIYKNKLGPDQFPCGLLDKTLNDFNEEANDKNDTHLDINTDNFLCHIDDQFLTINSVSELGETKIMSQTNKNNIVRIAYEELRDIKYKKFKFIKYLALGTLFGLIICLWMVGIERHETQHWPKISYAVTTILPILAISSFAGVLFGLMLPARSIQIYMLFSIARKNGASIKFVVNRQQFRKTKTVLNNNGWEIDH